MACVAATVTTSFKRADQSGNIRWVNYDYEKVTSCNEKVVVADTYGREVPKIWNYFDRPPQQLADWSAPMLPRIRNTYMP